MSGWLLRERPRRNRRPRNRRPRRRGCLTWLLWLAAVLVLLLVLSLLFGEWQTGTKTGLAPPRAVAMGHASTGDGGYQP